MRRMIVACALVGLALCVQAQARAFRVRRLDKNKKAQTGVWGTDEFQVNVNPLGCVLSVKVKGKEIVRQAARLYTSPIPPDAKKGLRTVQGEGIGNRGLTVERPKMKTRDEKGKRILEFEHLVANKKVLNGRPLCKVNQKVVITPTGEIHVSYDCEWLETVRWGGFSLLILFNRENCTDREYMVATGDVIRTGRLDQGPRKPRVRQIRRESFEQLTVRPEVGPVHFVWETKAKCSFYWGADIQLHMSPLSMPRRVPVFKGQRARIAYRILVPVSQQ